MLLVWEGAVLGTPDLAAQSRLENKQAVDRLLSPLKYQKGYMALKFIRTQRVSQFISESAVSTFSFSNVFPDTALSADCVLSLSFEIYKPRLSDLLS